MTGSDASPKLESEIANEVIAAGEELNWKPVEGQSIQSLLIGHADPGSRMARILNSAKELTAGVDKLT